MCRQRLTGQEEGDVGDAAPDRTDGLAPVVDALDEAGRAAGRRRPCARPTGHGPWGWPGPRAGWRWSRRAWRWWRRPRSSRVASSPCWAAPSRRNVATSSRSSRSSGLAAWTCSLIAPWRRSICSVMAPWRRSSSRAPAWAWASTWRVTRSRTVAGSSLRTAKAMTPPTTRAQRTAMTMPPCCPGGVTRTGTRPVSGQAIGDGVGLALRDTEIGGDGGGGVPGGVTGVETGLRRRLRHPPRRPGPGAGRRCTTRAISPRGGVRPPRPRPRQVPRQTSSWSLVSSRATATATPGPSTAAQVGRAWRPTGGAPRRRPTCARSAASSASRWRRAPALAGQEPLEDEPGRGQAAGDQGGDGGRRAGHDLDGVTVPGRSPDQALAWVGDPGHAGVGDHRDPLAPSQASRGRSPTRLGSLWSLTDQQRPALTPGVLEQPAGPAGVLAATIVGPGQRLDGAGREVAEVADRGPDEDERRRARSSSRISS